MNPGHDSTPSVLDNPAWNSLTGHHAHLAITQGRAKCYPLEVTRIVGLEAPDAATLSDLAEIVPPGEVVGYIGDAFPANDAGWALLQSFSAIQMVSTQPVDVAGSGETVVDLGTDDVPNMLDLIRLTEPGPFFPRTVEMGHYIGIRQQGQLVAMAGERMCPPGYREVSAVCTHPDYRGRGYARALMTRLMAEQRQRGETPILHVSPHNDHAHALYERMGFRDRGVVQFQVIRR
jgi:predicted GNAT family acetyltransferase